MKIYIYCLFDENKIPIYIGKTKNSLSLRESQHQNRLNKIVKIFELDYIHSNDWKFWEEYWIEQFKQWGFLILNKNKGGGGVESHTDESRLKMQSTLRPNTSIKLKGRKRDDVSKRLKGTKFSIETRNKISKAKTNHICYNDPSRSEKIIESNKDNYKIGSERNIKISEKLKGRKADWMKNRCKSIIQYDLDGNFIKEWNSGVEAALYLNKPSASISECCNGKRKSAYKFIWKYK
jgi:hypothetical protein